MYYDYYLYYLSYLSSLYNGYPIIVRITVLLIMCFAVILSFGIGRLLLVGYNLNKAAKRKNKLKEQYLEKLGFIFSNKSNYDVEEIDELLEFDQKKVLQWKYEMMTDLVLQVKDGLESKNELNLLNYKNTLEALKIMPFWEKRLRTSEVALRKNALQMVGLLNNGLNTGLISKSVYHKNRYLRKAARSVHTDLDDYNPFRFMEENFDESFTQLDKIRLHATLVRRNKDGKLPNLLRWVNNSKNNQYIAFIIQEIGHFKQYNAAPNLLDMLDKVENRDVRIQIVSTLGDLDYVKAVSNLTQRYALESTPIRESILQTLGVLKAEKSLEFLLETYNHTNDDNLKIAIARSIHNQGQAGEENLMNIQQAGTDTEQVIIKHVFSENQITKA